MQSGRRRQYLAVQSAAWLSPSQRSERRSAARDAFRHACSQPGAPAAALETLRTGWALPPPSSPPSSPEIQQIDHQHFIMPARAATESAADGWWSTRRHSPSSDASTQSKCTKSMQGVGDADAHREKPTACCAVPCHLLDRRNLNKPTTQLAF